MKTIERIRRDFEREFGEPGYSADEIANVATRFGSTVSVKRVKNYSQKKDLLVYLEKSKIDLTGSNVKYLIPRRNLEALIEGIGIDTTAEKFQEELEFLRDRANNIKRRKYR